MKQHPAHPAYRYDEHLVLKIPPLLWMAMLFLVRHAILILLSYLPRTGDAMIYLRDLVDPIFLLADLPAALVLFSAVRRKPEAPDWMRALWQKGRTLLAGSALLYLVLLAGSLTASARPPLSILSEALILSVFLNLTVLAYLGRSPLVRDVFAEFPIPSNRRI